MLIRVREGDEDEDGVEYERYARRRFSELTIVLQDVGDDLLLAVYISVEGWYSEFLLNIIDRFRFGMAKAFEKRHYSGFMHLFQMANFDPFSSRYRTDFLRFPWRTHRAATTQSGAVIAIKEWIERQMELRFSGSLFTDYLPTQTQYWVVSSSTLLRGMWCYALGRTISDDDERGLGRLEEELVLGIGVRKDPRHEHASHVLVEVYGDPVAASVEAQALCRAMQAWWPTNDPRLLPPASQTHETDRDQRSMALAPDSASPPADAGFPQSSSATSREPQIPTRDANLRRWKATWRIVFREVVKGQSVSELVTWLERTHPDIACSEDTLRRIIRAGTNGELG